MGKQKIPKLEDLTKDQLLDYIDWLHLGQERDRERLTALEDICERASESARYWRAVAKSQKEE